MNKQMGFRRINIGQIVLQYGFIIALIILVAVFSVLEPNFLSLNNFLNLFHTLAPTLIMVSGLAFVILTGAIDFSIGSIAYLASAIGIMLMVNHGVPIWLGLTIIVIAGGLIGSVNGFIIEFLRVDPLITTFGTMLIFRGIAYIISNAMYVEIPKELSSVHNIKIGPVFLDIIIALLVILILYYVQQKTIFGRHIMALGNGRDSAEKLAVNTRKVSFMAYILSGLMAGLGSLFYLFQMGYLMPRMGNGLEFSGIAIVIVGGISLFGGIGSITGLIIGAFTMFIIENGLQNIGVSVYIYPLLRGGIIFLAMYADSLKERARQARKLSESYEGGELSN